MEFDVVPFSAPSSGRSVDLLIGRLPDEILVEIFRLTNRPLTAALVCRRWRDLVVNVAEFWANVELELPIKDERLSVYLERSKKRPFDFLLIGIKIRTNEDILKAMNEIDISPHIHRMKSCRLFFRHPCHIDLALSKFAQPAPALEFLQLIVDDRTRTNMALRSIFAGQHPSLRRVELVGTFPRGIFRNLTELELWELRGSLQPSVAELLITLAESPLLERFLLFNAGPRYETSKDLVRPYVAEHLRFLSFSSFQLPVAPQLIPNLITPNLRNYSVFADLPTLKEIKRSLNQFELLERLNLLGHHMTPEALAAFGELPSLRDLSMVGALQLCDSLDMLCTPTENGSWICPRLEHLAISHAPADDRLRFHASIQKLVTRSTWAEDVEPLRILSFHCAKSAVEQELLTWLEERVIVRWASG